jgi:hypothetical protein
MTQRDSALFKTGWISLAIIGLAILLFGLITALMPASSGPPYLPPVVAGVRAYELGLVAQSYAKPSLPSTLAL